jgi:hypothetical protein
MDDGGKVNEWMGWYIYKWETIRKGWIQHGSNRGCFMSWQTSCQA